MLSGSRRKPSNHNQQLADKQNWVHKQSTVPGTAGVQTQHLLFTRQASLTSTVGRVGSGQQALLMLRRARGARTAGAPGASTFCFFVHHLFSWHLQDQTFTAGRMGTPGMRYQIMSSVLKKEVHLHRFERLIGFIRGFITISQ